MQSQVANQALLIPLHNNCSEPVIAVLLPQLNLVLFTWEDVSDEPCVVNLKQVRIVLKHGLDDASGDDAVRGET